MYTFISHINPSEDMLRYLVLLRVDLGDEPLDLRPGEVGDGEEEDVLQVLVLEVPAVRQVEVPDKRVELTCYYKIRKI